ncbi:DNA/RNA-binding protein AlbA [archaeon]|nr:DNA/RNA-binding protein AlbA [archaeon]
MSERTAEILIGRKEPMRYVMAIIQSFAAGYTEIHLRARGMAIKRAVDTVQIIKRSIIPELKIKAINIGSEQITRQDGRTGYVSTIEIVVTKGEEKEEKKRTRHK